MGQSGYQDQIVWIVGASSGIGLALAHELASRGAVLALSGRRQDALESLQAQLGPQHKIFVLDVTNDQMVQRTAQAIRASMGRIDRVIYLAAAYARMKMTTLDMAVTQQIINTNLMGAFHIVHAAVPILKSQPTRGQLALCASVAGYVGLPGGQPYSATKAAMINLAESLHSECNGAIDIKLINPGFVRTPMTDLNDFNMPMIIEPQQAARQIADGLLRSGFEIHFPRRFTVILKLVRTLPYWLLLRLLGSIKP